MIDTRKNGILLPISSLPGNFGIGTLGHWALKTVDLLSNANQTYWQILPIGPTGYGDSPYQSFSTFAGNPYFIDFELLHQDGYLLESDYNYLNWNQNPSYVDYGLLYFERKKVFTTLFNNFYNNIPEDFTVFCNENAFWLDDYALYMSIKQINEGKPFYFWEKDIRTREVQAINTYKEKCSEQIKYYKMLQYFFFKQWYNLKSYANSKGIKIIGDVPIYVSSDSSDAWANPELFQLDQNSLPQKVAGCPPDAFSESGQLWGNPVYNWNYHNQTDYKWWKLRISMSFKNYDVLRIDHFRGFDSYYAIPYGDDTAKNGQWETGPGLKLFESIKKDLGDLPIIAEDLGILTDSVKQLLIDSDFPGMKVLQFAFSPYCQSDYLPYKYTKNCVVYTGTHDNDTILGWTNTQNQEEVNYAMQYYCVNQKHELREKMILSGMESVANTCIICIQDLIGLGSEARLNFPSTQGSNWKWRATPEQLENINWEQLKHFTKLFGRA